MQKFSRFFNDKNMTKFKLKPNPFSLVPIFKSIILSGVQAHNCRKFERLYNKLYVMWGLFL